MSSQDRNIRASGKFNDTGESTKQNTGLVHGPMDGVNTTAYTAGTTLMGLPDGYPNMFYPSGTTAGAGTGGTGPMSYPNFGSTDAPWATPAFDPNIMGAPGYNDTGLVTQPPLQSPHFYFPSNDSFWNSDLLTSPFFMNYSFLGGVPTVEQPRQQHHQQVQQADLQPSATTAIASTTAENNSVDSLGQQFSSALTVNGTSLGMGLQDSLDNSSNGSSNVVVESPDSSSNTHTSSAPAPDKPKSWAAVAKLPPKPPQPKPVTVVPANDMRNGGKPSPQPPLTKQLGVDNVKRRPNPGIMTAPVLSSRPRQQLAPQGGLIVSPGSNIPEIVHKLHAENNYNPKEFCFSVTNARYFVIKSYAEDDIHRSIKYSIWTSTEHGNKRLDAAYREQKGKGNIYLFYSVNGSGHFCGVAQMESEVNFHVITGVWSQDKWKGRFSVKWLYVKDVPNNALRHIRLENNENKPVTNSRDTQEIPSDKAKLVMKIVHDWRATSSIFDDFGHYEEKEVEDKKGSS